MSKKKQKTKHNQIQSPQNSMFSDMYKSVKIENFRGFQRLEIKNLERLNLFLGANNSGKTSVIEAIFTHACGYNYGPFEARIRSRSLSEISSALDYGNKFLSIFNNRNLANNPHFQITASFENASKPVEVKSVFKPSYLLAELLPENWGDNTEIIDYFTKSQNKQLNIGQSIGVWEIFINSRKQDFQIFFPPQQPQALAPIKMGAFCDVFGHRNSEMEFKLYSHLKRRNLISEFVADMNIAFSNIKNIDMLPFSDGSKNGVIYLETDDNLKLPLASFGDGLRRWIYLLSLLIRYKDSIHCIEEIDSGFHYKAQLHLAKYLYEYSTKYNNQLFMTSHSLEFLDAFLESLYGDEGIVPEGEDPVRVFSIKRNTGDDIEIWSFSGREALNNRQNFQLELRG